MQTLVVDQTFQLNIGSGILEADLRIPDHAKGLILFAHGSGSSRLSPRNRYVAELLNEAGFATCLLDLLTRQEEQQDAATGHLRFNIEKLSDRLLLATMFLKRKPLTQDLAIGYFGASTGAAAAIMAAAQHPEFVRAVVSRGGRPDLAGSYLSQLQTPTLLLVGSRDFHVIQLNEAAFGQMTAPKELILIPGASHLFQEPGTLKLAAQHAMVWFAHHLAETSPVH